jgi:hypothetical protein
VSERPDPRDAVSVGDGPWIAVFRDGPVAEHGYDRVFSIGPVWSEIVLAPFPPPHGYQIVGGGGLPPSEPWPGQVRYVLAEVVATAGPRGEPVALYGVVPVDAVDV